MWTLVPPNLRVPFLCAVSLAWSVALSTLANRQGQHTSYGDASYGAGRSCSRATA